VSEVLQVAGLTKTYAIEKGRPALAALDLLALAGFTAGLFALAAKVLAQRVA
jgi:hypothetical protein